MISIRKDNKTILNNSFISTFDTTPTTNTTKPIPIPVSNHSSQSREYELQKHFFDPSKHSPPNEFMLKLYLRKYIY